MRRAIVLLCFLFCFASRIGAQGFSEVNFSQGIAGTTPTATQIFDSWYGYKGSGMDTAFSCTIGTISCDVHISNSSNAITIQNQSAWGCDSGVVPPNSGGPSAKILDYSTTLASGVSGQYILFNYPNAQSSPTQGSVWFCTTIPATANFGTTFDGVVIVGPASRISNYIDNGSQPCFGIETNTGQTCIPFTSGHAVQVVWQTVNGGACSDLVNFTDCMRLQLYDINGNLLGSQYENTGGSGGSSYLTLGNLNAITFPSGNYHVQFMNLKICSQGCTTQEFPMLQYPVPAWDGIISPLRAMNWSVAGIPTANTGTLPDAAWTQCGSTVAAGTSAASVQSLVNGCTTPNQYLLLGPGAFTWSAHINLPSSGNFVIRGSGANSTFITMTGGAACPGQTSSAFCIASSDGTYTTQPPANTCTWTAGLAQGSTSVTLANLAGTCLSGISTTTPTILFFDGCDSGSSGPSCGSGTVTDNGNAFICGAQYSSPNGCSFDGPDSGGSRTGRNQLEGHVATAVNTGTGAVSLLTPIYAPNFGSASNPQVWIVQPVVNEGIEDMAIDLSNSGAPQGCVDVVSAYHIWISGVKCTNNKRDAFNLFQVVNSLVVSNYIFGSTGILPSNYGIRLSATTCVVTQNNIIQQIQGGPLFYDGAGTCDVDGYNFPVKSETGGDLTPITEHAGDYMFLHEGTHLSISCDNVHGTCNWSTRFRSFLPGWTSDTTTNLGTFTNGIADFAFARYINNIGNVLGTPGYQNTYTSTSSNTAIYWAGTGGGAPSIPTDALTKSTSLFWASYDTVTNTTGGLRFCGNPLDTNYSSAAYCNNTPEVNVTASTYPNFVPVYGDTAIGQAPMVASFYLNSTPSWFGSIPFPPIGPDVSGGDIGICSGTLNTPGHQSGMPATSSGQCTGTSLTTPAWGGHVNAIPAENCYLNVMGGPPDGTGSVLAFDRQTCYGSSSGSVTLTPSSQNFGSFTVGSPSSPITFTVTNGSATTATSVSPSVTGGNTADFAITNTGAGSCNAAGGSIAASASCTFTVIFTPGAAGSRSTTLSVSYSGGDSASPQTSSLSGTGTTGGNNGAATSIGAFAMFEKIIASPCDSIGVTLPCDVSHGQ